MSINMNAECSFHALDVETANSSWASVCQIGIVHVTNGVVTDQWSTYVHPEEHFDAKNTWLHGIDEGTVCDAPSFPELHPELHQRLDGGIVVSHSGFDRGALQRVTDKYGTADLNLDWLDSVWIARRAWPELQRHKLKYLADVLGLEFHHHDAVEDARIAAEVVLAACRETGRTVADWITLRDAGSGGTARRSRSVSRIHTMPDLAEISRSTLASEYVVFTGNAGIRRTDMKAMVETAGGHCERSVTQRTTMLVVGYSRGRTSNKQRKAEVLQRRGQPVRVLSVAEFLARLAGG